VTRMLKVAVVQMVCENGNVQRNLRHAEALIQQAASQGAELALLPELMPNGFIMTEELWNSAEPFDGFIVEWLKSTSKRLSIYLGLTFLEAEGGDFFNTFALTTPSGDVAGRVRKSPPASFEAYFYRGGNDAHIIETELGRIGVGICYENAFYERLSALHERAVDLVLQPTSAPSLMASLPFRKKDVAAFDRWIGDMPGHYARELGVPVMMANKCGPFSTPLPAFFPHQQSVFPGLSTIVDCDGIVKGQLGASEGIIVTEVTLDSKRKVVSRPRGCGRWTGPRPWHAFLMDWTQQMGTRAYAKNPRREVLARLKSSARTRALSPGSA
jgi:N-carbamoylputrescine amidase